MRAINFLKRYLFKNPFYVIVFLFFYHSKNFSFSTNLINRQQVVEEVGGGKSIIRLGDGEINLILGLNNHYQSYDKKLGKVIKNIILNYNNNSDYILAVPRFINCSNEELKKMGKFQVWYPLKVVFFIFFKKNLKYLDAHSFYYDNYFEDVVVPAIINRNIILITNEKTINLQKSNPKLPWKNIDFVSAPDNDALSSREKIIKNIENKITPDNVNTVLLFAMGPVGKDLAFHYTKKGVQSIDIGKVAEVMFTDTSIEYII